MFNVAVINLKKMLKDMVKLIIAIAIIAMIFNFIKTIKFDIKGISKIKFSYINLISDNIILSKINNTDNVKVSAKSILSSELIVFSEVEEEIMLKESMEELQEEIVPNEEVIVSNSEVEQEEQIGNSIENKNAIDSSLINVKTEVIEEKNKKDVFTDTYGSVKIKNESKYELTKEMMTPNVSFNNKKDILIFHTHTCESYTPTEAKKYVASGNFRTIDLNYSVAHVGDELTKHLTEKGYNVTHNKTYHDYPAYSGSYNRSYKTVSSELSGDSWTEFVIDLHRDALGSNSAYAPSVKIGEEIGAQLMFVMGTDGGGLDHPNWLNNFKLAVMIQEKANEMYPGLFKPIILRNSRYNQNLASGACIIEVGATGNTLEECEVSMKYLANVIAEVMK